MHRARITMLTALLALSLPALTGCGDKIAETTQSGMTITTMSADYANVHLVSDGTNAILIDTGYPENAAALIEGLPDAGLDPATLRAIILTHAHYDHAGGAAALAAHFDVPVIAGAGDAALLNGAASGTVCPVGYFAKRRRDEAETHTFPAVSADILIENQTSLDDLAGMKGEVIPLPGHTPGSLVIVIDEMAFVGDLFRGQIFRPEQAEIHFFMCDLEDNRSDISMLLTDLAPQAEVFYTGHFGPVLRPSVEGLIE